MTAIRCGRFDSSGCVYRKLDSAILMVQACVYRILDSTILMVKTAKDRARCHGAESLDDAMERRVLDQRSVSSEFVVIVGIGGQVSAQVRFPEDYDVVQAISPDRAYEAFDVPILPR